MTTESELGIELLKLLYIFSSSLGLWTCLHTALNKRCPRSVKRRLCLFVGILLVIPVNAYLDLILENPIWLIHSFASTITWCYGPLMYMLINDAVQKKQSFSTLSPQFLPFICIALVHFTRLDWIHFELYMGFLFLQLLCYLWLSASTLLKNRSRLKILGKEFKNSTYYWLLYLIGGMFVIALYDNALVLVLHLGGSISYLLVSLTIAGFSIYISTIALLLLIQPEIFEQTRSVQAHSVSKTNGPAPVKRRHAELSHSAAEALIDHLATVVTEQKLHLDPEISLSKLSNTLGISNHQLSELFNIHLQTSFYDYLNNHRFNEALKLMHQTSIPQSVTDIAFLSGFNNRNSFYRVFKEQTGLTPGEYRKKLQTDLRSTFNSRSTQAL